MTIIELVSTIVISTAGILGATKGVIETLQRRKLNTTHEKVVESFENSDKAYKRNTELGQKYGANYSFIVRLHDSGKAINELSIKKISILHEFKREYHFPSKEDTWQQRKMPSDMMFFISKLIQNESLHIPNICDGYRRGEGLRALFNARRGQEVFMSVIDWVGDSLVVLIMQMDFDYIEKGKMVWCDKLGYKKMVLHDEPAGALKASDFHKLTISDQAHIKHIAKEEISKLYASARWLIKNEK